MHLMSRDDIHTWLYRPSRIRAQSTAPSHKNTSCHKRENNMHYLYVYLQYHRKPKQSNGCILSKTQRNCKIRKSCWNLVIGLEPGNYLSFASLPTDILFSISSTPVDACNIVVPPCTVCKKICHQHKTGPSPRSKTFELPSLFHRRRVLGSTNWCKKYYRDQIYCSLMVHSAKSTEALVRQKIFFITQWLYDWSTPNSHIISFWVRLTTSCVKYHM